MAQALAATGDTAAATQCLESAAASATEAGLLHQHVGASSTPLVEVLPWYNLECAKYLT